MAAQYGAQHRWTTHFSNTGPHIQLEEQYFPPEHTHAHPQHYPLTHNATYPPNPPAQYYASPPNVSHRPSVGQQHSIRPQAIDTTGVNAGAFDHSAQATYMGSTSSSPEDAYGQTPNIANIFYHHAPQQQEFNQQSYPTEGQAQIPVQPRNPSDPLVPNMRRETGPSPQFASSSLSTNPPQAPGPNPAYYRFDVQPQQQTLQFDMTHSTSGSQSSPGEMAASQDYVHQQKRVRPNEDDDNTSAYYIDVGMDHEAEGLQDDKGSSKTKLGACARCKSLKVGPITTSNLSKTNMKQ